MNNISYRLKSCPRCGGDIAVDRRINEATCIQCGYTRYPPPLPLVPGFMLDKHSGKEKIQPIPARLDVLIAVERPCYYWK